MTTAAIILIVIMFSVYGLLTSIECGVCWTMLFPKLTNNPRSNNIYTPIWEITNVFLVFGMTAMAMFFNGGLVKIIDKNAYLLFIAGLGLLVRAVTGLYIFYVRKNPAKLSKFILLCASYLTPICIGCVGIYLFTGHKFSATHLGQTLLLSIFFGLTLIGIAFANRFKLKIVNKVKYTLYALYLVWAILLGYFLPKTAQSLNVNLVRLPLALIALIIATSTIVYFGFAAMKDKVHELYQFVMAVAFIVPVILAVDLRPYLIFNNITLAKAYGASAYQYSIIVGTIICTPLLLFAGYLIFKLLIDAEKSKK
ncbi:MAG TPA: cytochrome d ubiquinol oxidase subunit II [Candidatus Saccharimonadia bacterium]|nr:cytochrome d ubiquinol oxidase subunit II [Candidatus Saccharimonadia bacterium]